MRVLIVGCGYVGSVVGAELARQGHEVFGIRRSTQAEGELKTAGIKLLASDITRAADLAALPGPFDWVVNCAASTRGASAADYRQVYFDGTRNLIEWLSASPPKKFVYTSSTGVYGQTDGSQVKESSPAEPASETGRVLVEAEKLLLDAARDKKFPAVILRLAGIYGPDREHFLHQYVKNEARIPGKGERFMNMIHRDDAAGCVIAALKNGRAGEVYNGVDDEPVSHLNFFRWLSEELGKWMPEFESAEEAATAKSGREATNKRVQNRRIKMELGYAFKYPNFRQGYTAEILRLERAGLLDVQLEKR